MDDRKHLISLTKRQMNIIFFALTEDAVCGEYPEKEVHDLLDILKDEMNTA